jgi:hypothetical protein
MKLICMLAALSSLACAARDSRHATPGPPAVEAARAPAPRKSPPPPELAPASGPVPVATARVIVTGVLERRGQEIEICPGRVIGPCPGIRIVGAVEEAWLSEPGNVTVWRLTGSFEGLPRAPGAER